MAHPDQPHDGPDAEQHHLLSPEHVLQQVVPRLAEKYRGVFSSETITRYLDESYDLLSAGARIQRHTPVPAIRFASQRLANLGKIEGAIVTTTPEVLFVCVHNAGRSQMAAALLHHHAEGTVTVRSAGSAPADTINPAVIAAMDEIGLDLSREFPKPLTNDAVQAADVVITMGCGDACPIYPGKHYLDWDLPDPADKPLGQVRPIRDEIDHRVRALLAELIPHRA
jgi:protein-tyrosine-phosphatase